MCIFQATPGEITSEALGIYQYQVKKKYFSTKNVKLFLNYFKQKKIFLEQLPLYLKRF